MDQSESWSFFRRAFVEHHITSLPCEVASRNPPLLQAKISVVWHPIPGHFCQCYAIWLFYNQSFSFFDWLQHKSSANAVPQAQTLPPSMILIQFVFVSWSHNSWVEVPLSSPQSQILAYMTQAKLACACFCCATRQ